MNTRQKIIPGCLLLALLSYALPSGAQTVTAIAAGSEHTLFTKSDGSLWGMGDDIDGQLGTGPGINFTNVPQLIVSNGVTGVVAGEGQSFFFKGAFIWAMGNNAYGQLGNGSNTDIFFPQQIGSGFALATGYTHTLFIRSSGLNRIMDAMGDNLFGELGDRGNNNQLTPEQIESDSTLILGSTYVTAVAAGTIHSLFLKSDGSLWSVGSETYGELGDGFDSYNGHSSTNKPEKVVSSGVTTIAAGRYCSLFIKSDGSLWGMGDNGLGELGTSQVPAGGQTNRPVSIWPSGVMAIAGGTSHNLFLTSGGKLWGMGYNYNGELGVGTFDDAHLPVQITGGGVTAMAAGEDHSLFLMSDGSLWGMGFADYGQLGPAYTGNQPRPVQIIGPLVANGGFETGNFDGWITNLDNENVASIPAHSGSYAATMGNTGSLGFMSQNLATVPGKSYLLSFWVKYDGNNPSEFKASWNNNVLLDLTNPHAGGWTNLQYVLSASTTNTPLQFGFRDDIGYVDLDDVRVVPLDPPGITSFSLDASSNIVLNATNGQWNGIYVTLMGTNLTQPLNQWKPVATNTLATGGGKFSINLNTGVDPSVAQRLYRLQLE